MAVRRVLIEFPPDREYAYYTGVWHFAEALWSDVVTPGYGRLNDIDRGREMVWVDVASTRHLGTVLAAVRRALRRCGLEGEAKVRTVRPGRTGPGVL